MVAQLDSQDFLRFTRLAISVTALHGSVPARYCEKPDQAFVLFAPFQISFSSFGLRRCLKFTTFHYCYFYLTCKVFTVVYNGAHVYFTNMGKNRINKGTIYWLSNVGPVTFEPKMGARPPSLRLGHSETKEKLRKSPFFADCDAAFLTRQPITGQVPFPYQGGPEISRTAGCWHPGMEQELRLCKENIGWWWFSMGFNGV